MPGMRITVTGEANDYVAKGMGGGRISITPPANDAGSPCLVGNTSLYGATGGQLFVVPGRAHRDTDGPAADADLQRLLVRKRVRLARGIMAARPAHDRAASVRVGRQVVG